MAEAGAVVVVVVEKYKPGTTEILLAQDEQVTA